MGRLNRRQEHKARAGEDSLAARRAREALVIRGISISRRELGRRSLAECIDANNWARNRRPLSLRPGWIETLLQTGRGRYRAGVCFVCGCTHETPCLPWGCRWTTRARTICSACDLSVPLSLPVADFFL